ncbi:MAG: hypothetical protein ACRDKZ_03625, partial [Actinomycetota bacterium]
MSVLLIGVPPEIAEILIPRLVSEGDEVRVLERDEAISERWRVLGAYLAGGTNWDADLIERAAQNVRTLVLGGAHSEDPASFSAEVIEGARLASREMRVVLLDPPDGVVELMRGSSLDYVALFAPRRGLLRRGTSVAPLHVAEAIDAADDLSG